MMRGTFGCHSDPSLQIQVTSNHRRICDEHVVPCANALGEADARCRDRDGLFTALGPAEFVSVGVSTATVPAAPPDFRALSTEVRAAGLLDRRLGYYAGKVVLTLGAYAALWWAFFAVGNSWATLGIAVLLGIVSTQLGFLGHDAGHRQIFASRRANRLLGLLIGNGMIGMSFGWWVPKHNAHHAHPNEVGRDPDIGVGLVKVPREDDQPGAHHGLAARLERRQAELFFPLMLLRSTGLYVSGVQDLIRRRDRAALTEGSVLVLHAALYLTAVFWVLPPFKAIAFLAVHEAVFSLYLGCSFAPNHKGMPLIVGDPEMSFAQQQVVTRETSPVDGSPPLSSAD